MIKAEWTNKDSLDLQPTCNQLATTEGELINKRDAIDCVRWGDSVTNVIDRINALPSAPDSRQRGEWVHGIDEETGEKDLYPWTCSVCNKEYPWQPNFCPNCGARMFKGGEDE